MLPTGTLVPKLAPTYALNMFYEIVQEILSTISYILGFDAIFLLMKKS